MRTTPDTPRPPDDQAREDAERDARGGRGTGHVRFFEDMYRAGAEPWSYSERAVETLRHERVAALVGSLAPRRVLDLGCSLGLMTERLAALPAELWATDLSPTAVARARERLAARAPRGDGARFVAGSALRLPVADASFDLILASDGLNGWELSRDDRAAALREIHRALEPGGHAVLTDHMRPNRFAGFVDEVRASPLRVVRVTYLYDRPCYQFEGWLKGVSGWRVARALRRSMPLARGLTAVGRLFGPAGSRHIVVVARRD
jgi:SAM-dependent methyltransferase